MSARMVLVFGKCSTAKAVSVKTVVLMVTFGSNKLIIISVKKRL